MGSVTIFNNGPLSPEGEKNKKLRLERDRAEQEMTYKFANLQMPEDMRARAPN